MYLYSLKDTSEDIDYAFYVSTSHMHLAYGHPLKSKVKYAPVNKCVAHANKKYGIYIHIRV